MDLRCSSIFSDNETLINVHCNTTNGENIFKRPEEGTKQCIQTIQVCYYNFRFRFAVLTKQLNSQTNFIALEKMKKIQICLIFI